MQCHSMNAVAKRTMKGLAAAIVAVAAAQTAASPAAFEVASVKPYISPPPATPGVLAVVRRDPPPAHFVISGTRVSATGNLLALVRLSYALDASHVRLGRELAEWATGELYTIEARAPGDTIPKVTQVQEMMQTLLAERFQLKVSRSTQVMPVYDLVVAPGGPKLTPTAFADSSPVDRDEGSTRTHLRRRLLNFSIPDLVDWLRRSFDRPLLDKTGLTGGFDFSLDYEVPPTPGASAEALAAMGATDIDSGVPIVTAFREQLGLRVVRAREPVEILVMEHAEKPAAN